MRKVLVVVAATGQQGGSVVNSVLGDAELSKEYSIRGTTRDPNQAKARELTEKGVELIHADADDAASLKKAFEGAHVVFAYTTTVYDGRTYEHEVTRGRALVDAAVAAGVPFYVFSTLPNAGKICSGRLKHMDHFNAREEVEQYIRMLPIKSAFIAPGLFMSNFHTYMLPQPTSDSDGTYALTHFVTPDTQLPLIDTAGDTGKWVAAILADFDRYEGTVLCCATALYTVQETVEVMSKASGKTVVYSQLPEETWSRSLPPKMKDHVAEMWTYIQDYGYYGDETEKKVRWAAEQARGKLTKLDAYFQAHPLKLQ